LSASQITSSTGTVADSEVTATMTPSLTSADLCSAPALTSMPYQVIAPTMPSAALTVITP